jgi:probable HAF family extracellular repeat protein
MFPNDQVRNKEMSMIRHNQSILLSLAAAMLMAVALSASRSAAADRYTVTDLGALPGQPFSSMWQQTINSEGVIAAYANSDPFSIFFNDFVGDSPYLWKDGRITPLPVLLNAVDTIPFHINNEGQAVGRATQVLPFNHAVLWDERGIHVLPELPGDTRSAALSINDSGQAVGYSRVAGNRRAALWFKGTVSQLPPLPGGGTFDEGLGIGETGIVVGFSGPSSDLTGIALWDNHGVHDLGSLGGKTGAGFAINNKKQVVGFSDTWFGTEDPVLWENGVLTDLGNLPGDVIGQAWDLNNKGQIVGWSAQSLDDTRPLYPVIHALLWEKGKLINLQTAIPANSGWTLLQAVGVNERGQIVVSATFNGNLRGALLTPRED